MPNKCCLVYFPIKYFTVTPGAFCLNLLDFKMFSLQGFTSTGENNHTYQHKVNTIKIQYSCCRALTTFRKKQKNYYAETADWSF